jgi:2-methylcitrate dehydratase PrpD
MPSCSEKLADWVCGLDFGDLPADVVASTKDRVLDVIGLALAGLATPFGASVTRACASMNPSGPSRILGSGHRMSTGAAAFANGALSQALEFDDTHNESIVHMSGPAVAAALALSEARTISGQALITAIALGNEISCRVGSVAPGQFHRRGFHPTGLFAPFGATCLAGWLLGLTRPQLSNAAGIVGSFAAGILECWVDGTQSKFLHPGWAAQSGITAAHLGQAGVSGPAAVLEGRFGLFDSHLQDHGAARALHRVTDGLGDLWESRKASFKPFPAAHVLHPYVDAALKLRRQHGVDPREIRAVICPVASYIVPIVCEPLAEKRRPNTDSHGRVSFQYTLAEALHFGALGKDAYQADSLRNPEILRLADLVTYRVDTTFPGPDRFKGAVRIVMNSGAAFEASEEHNRGSFENPMTREELLDKFERNAASVLSTTQTGALVAAIAELEAAPDASTLVQLSMAG